MSQSEYTVDQITRGADTRMENNIPPLLKREFVTVDTEATTGDTIRLMQWNMLAQGLIHNFPRCPPKALDLEFRRQRIAEEIIRYKPTVICLEEVDQFDFLSKSLKKYGYHGIFKPKPASPCLDFLKNWGPDGCAVFFDLSALELVTCDDVELRAWHMETNQVAVICHFKTKSKFAKDFTVAVTHLKAGPQGSTECEDIRKEQAIFLSTYLKEKHGKYPLILCGDLNFPTTEKGYEVLRTCDLGLTSAYTSLSADDQEPKYTFWTVTDQEICKTIDYVWYTKQGLKVKSLLDVASEEEIGQSRMPSLKYPSDHISLVCDFELESESSVSEDKKQADKNQRTVKM